MNDQQPTRYVIQSKENQKYIHEQNGRYILKPGLGNGLIIFDRRFIAKNFRRMFVERANLEIVPYNG